MATEMSVRAMVMATIFTLKKSGSSAQDPGSGWRAECGALCRKIIIQVQVHENEVSVTSSVVRDFLGTGKVRHIPTLSMILCTEVDSCKFRAEDVLGRGKNTF